MFHHRPRIAINCDYDPGKRGARIRRRATLYMPYIEAIEEAGGLPILIPPSPPKVLREYLELADGILFTGGDDYPPQFYGEKPRPEVQVQAKARAESDRHLMRLALHSDKPAFGICAGLQLLNIASGGALIQHLDGARAHQAKDEEHDKSHSVAVSPDTKLARIFRARALTINSSHHQAADPERLGQGLRIAARAPDGTVEALELQRPGNRFFLFVQWHPERIEDAAHRRKIFRAFIDACRRRR